MHLEHLRIDANNRVVVDCRRLNSRPTERPDASEVVKELNTGDPEASH
jgi:hypothetical protein